ncbi:Ig-like domain-containing protein [uncultured Desulfosarcina sp.]|uniref:Ig-like domain-containing protein n=1 Tax=uncultured Desulfosarcina sp. TaxID=218289 RepID=UPI0029C7A94C|nr:Ig-like domain-containing protein [uncultured Desulfosarcina sp.]
MEKSGLEVNQANQETAAIGDSMGRAGHIVTWRSSKPHLVAINDYGLVKALSPGETTITATCEGRVATARVIVAAPETNSMTVVPWYAGISVGETLQLKTMQQDAGEKKTTELTRWHSNQPSLVTVNQLGLVKAKKSGIVTITATQGELEASAIIEIGPVEKIHGLDFPGCAGVNTTMRFEFVEPLSAYPATYIWRAYPRQQQSYYTAFFWGNNGQFYPSNTYYGFHPYPDWKTSYQHFWEIAAAPGGDFTSFMHVIYDRWYIQVAVCRQTDNTREIEFYWDWPDAAKVIKYTGKPFGDPPSPGLIIGDAPWNQGNEVWNGVLRGFQFYNVALTTDEISQEITSPGKIYRPWYLNLNPSPKDIFDKSGSANHPEWVGTERPWQWNGELHRDIIFQQETFYE